MNILITGSNGQVGTALKEVVSGFDEYGDIKPNNNYIFTSKDGSEETLALDVTDKEAIDSFMKEHCINVIVNLAAYTDVDGAEINEDEAKELNDISPKYLAESAKENGAVLIHISTDFVYNGQTFIPYDEERTKLPLNVYGETKSKGEDNIINSGCYYIIIRTQWIYSNFGSNMFTKIFNAIKNCSEKKIDFVCDCIGSPTSAIDLAYIIYMIIEKNEKTHSLSKTGVYNYSGGGVASPYDFAYEIAEKLRIEYPEDILNPISAKEYYGKSINKARRPLYTVLNKDKFIKTFGVVPRHWKGSIIEMINRELQKN